MGLLRALLYCGFSGAIASTSPVDDTLAPKFFRKLHASMGRGSTADEAIRYALSSMEEQCPLTALFGLSSIQYFGLEKQL